MDTKKLRQKILDLAIRGKLVPQDPNDEPASVLLERIRAEKEQLIKEGKIKRAKKSAASDTSHYENVPYVIPVGWVWCRLEDIAYVAAGSTPSKESFVENGVPYIKMYNLRNQKIDFEFHPQYITEEVHNNKLARSRTQPGDLLMNIVGPPLGKLAIIPESLSEANFNQAAVLIRPLKYKPAITKYLFYYLSELSEINSISTKGSAGQVNISLTQSQQMRIALPPLAELERITQKIESLFSKIDVVKTSTGNIYDLISKIKSSILEKALSGKLVSQDKTDEPAIRLLKSINPNYDSTDNRHYENVPTGWQFVKIKDVFTINPKNKVDDDIDAGFVSMSMIDDGYRDSYQFEKKKWALIKNGFTHFKDGDIAVAKISPCLENRKSMILKNLPNGIGAGTTELHIFRSAIVDPKFALYFFKSDYFINQCVGTFNGVVGQQRVGKNIIEDIMFPLPPYKEQRRISEKITQIFMCLDKITAEL